MTRRSAAFLVLACTVACNPNETFTERADGAPLMLAAFESYATEESVRSALGLLPVEILERSGLPDGDARPPYTIVRLRIRHYSHLGSVGELHLTLFNDRLMSAFFYPEDLRGYLTALKARGLNVGAGAKGASDGVVRLWMARDYRGSDYVAWVDLRLEAQSRRWISRYS
ncbi:MAG TPA: hypothetical protein VK877_01310 [Pseudolabrys sp.]|nr:hypothetical protein [Pseudolabrys sp.]